MHTMTRNRYCTGMLQPESVMISKVNVSNCNSVCIRILITCHSYCHMNDSMNLNLIINTNKCINTFHEININTIINTTVTSNINMITIMYI